MSLFNNDRFSKTVNIPNPLYQSLQGRYFVGQTEHIRFGKGRNGWGGLVNPINSDINLFVNAFTITNHSNQPFEAEIWFNPLPLGKPMISNNVTPANTTFSRPRKPRVKITYAESVKGFPREGGVMAFRRIVPPQSTLASDEDGKFIFPPGGTFIILLVSPNNEMIEAKVAFGWFEKDKDQHT